MQQIDKIFTSKSDNLFPVVGIGASAGGLDAFKRIIEAIPTKSGMAYILVQHLHPQYQSSLPEILQRETKIPVVEISDNVHVEPDVIYVLPYNKTLTASDGILKLSPRNDKKKFNDSIDIFFSSLAEVHGSKSIGVILSGTGTDGTEGLEKIKNYGGITFAQDAETAAFYAMPQNAIDAGIVDFILPPDKIVTKLVEMQQTYDTLSTSDTPDIYNQNDLGFNEILDMLKRRMGVDFNFYKKATINRRVIRRMMIHKLESIQDYQQYLEKDISELKLLFHDLLIKVTSFFRDPIAYKVLSNKILPELINHPSKENILRIWVPGCSTGQEVYSLAICVTEFLRDYPEALKVKIFGTDISEKSIKKARSGIYSKAEIENVSEDRLKFFIKKTDNTYRVTKQIKDLCIFTVHNFVIDPPFANMNLISCRNVLIYFEPFLQKKALTIFHYALKDKGVLFLGNSESVGNPSELFIELDKKNKFFIRKPTPGRFISVLKGDNGTTLGNENHFITEKNATANDYKKNADKILLSKYTPASVVVNEHFDVVEIRGATDAYLGTSPGKASLNIIKMAREGLGFEIRNGLQKSKSSRKPFTKHHLPLQNGKKSISIEIIPLSETIDLFYLIIFKEETREDVDQNYESGNNQQGNKYLQDEKDIRIEQQEKELVQTRKDALGISEEQEGINEELQNSNQELLSSSEELQSLNEELETSQEELQSTNEELITINQELYNRIDQLNHARKFSDSIISVMHEPLLVLDRNFFIRRSNEAFYKNFRLTENQTLGMNLFELQDNTWAITDLRKCLNQVKNDKQQKIELEVKHIFPLIGARDIIFNIQIITNEEFEPLILLALNDITERKHAEKILSMANNLERNAEMLNELYINSPAFMCTLRGPDHIYELINPAYQKLFGSRQIEGIALREALPELEGQGLGKVLDKIYQTGEIMVATESRIWFAYDEGLIAEERYFNYSGQPMYDEHKKIVGVLVFGYEVTKVVLARKKAEEDLELILGSIPQITIVASDKGIISFFNNYALQYSGLTLEEATTERGWEKIIHPDELTDLITLAKSCLRTGEEFYMELRLKRARDEKYRWHLLRTSVIRDKKNNSILLWVGVATDIQDQKIKEEKKDEFITIASHEMKTPLTSTKGYLQLLEMTLDVSNKEAHLMVRKALSSVNRLNNLITELLDISKIQNQKLDFSITNFDFNKMVADTIEDEQNAAPDYTIIKNGSTTSEIIGDRDRLQQVIINLLNNAIKYSPDAKKIFVTIKEKNGDLIFSVKDNGIGVSKENLKNVFKRYFRVEDQIMRFQGMGIGLYISNEIIKRHQGTMWVISDVGKGSTFYFSIPMRVGIISDANQ